MKIRRLFAIPLALAAMLASSVAAMAAPAFATSTVNVRSGPGTGYSVIGQLQRGERVDVNRCTAGWCYVIRTGRDGWVSQRYLNEMGFDDGYPQPTNPPSNPRPDPGPAPDPYPQPDPVFPNPGNPWPNPDPGFPWPNPGPGPNPGPNPGPVQPRNSVCFFSGANYSGQSFCSVPGDYDDNMRGRWNDAIRSIAVSGNASVLVCQNAGFGGRCSTVNRSQRSLGIFDRAISSYEVQ